MLTVSYFLLGGALLPTHSQPNPQFRFLLGRPRLNPYQMIFNIVSLVLLLLSMLLRRALDNENISTGSIGLKVTIFGVSVFFSVFIAGLPMGKIILRGTAKEALYVILIGFEIIVVYLLLFTRNDRSFGVPNGNSKPDDYSSINLDGPKARKMSEQAVASEEDKASV